MLRCNMASNELQGKYTRLRGELVAAYAAPICHQGLIERISRDLEQLGHQLRKGSVDEQGGDALIPGDLPSA
jgi:hypothetical protein